MNGKAEEQFRAAIVKGEYAPALVNLGNLEFLAGRMRDAIRYFDRALAIQARNVTALVGLARAHHGLENYGEARRYYEILVATDARLAERYGYLKLQGEQGVRASEAMGLAGAVDWEEER